MSNSVVSFLVPSPHALSLYGTEQLEHSFKHHIQHACGVSLEKSATSLISWLIAAGSSLCVSVNSICLACVQLTDAFCSQTNAFFRFYTPLVTDACRYGNIVHLYITPEIRSLVKLITAYCFSCQTEEGWKCFGVIMGTLCL